MATDLGDAFHKGLIRLRKRVQLTIPQMRWEMEYIEDEIPEDTLMKGSGTQIVAWSHHGRIGTKQKMRLRWNAIVCCTQAINSLLQLNTKGFAG